MYTIGPINYGPPFLDDLLIYRDLARRVQIIVFGISLLRGTIVNRTYDTHKNLPGI